MSIKSNNVVFKYKNNLIIRPPCSDFDHKYSISFRKDFDDLVCNLNFNVIIIDFAKVNFIDDSGLATIIYIWHKCSEIGIELIFCNLNDLSYMLIERKGIDSIIKITDTLHNALRVGIYYSKKMTEFCSNLDNMGTIFGASNSDQTIPAACNFIYKSSSSSLLLAM
jgi:anti-anti-sigma factor